MDDFLLSLAHKVERLSVEQRDLTEDFFRVLGPYKKCLNYVQGPFVNGEPQLCNRPKNHKGTCKERT